jgi:hypothetical protein
MRNNRTAGQYRRRRPWPPEFGGGRPTLTPVSIPVALAALVEQAEAYGPTAYLVTVGPEDRPHVVAVSVGWDGATLVVGAGRTTTANVGPHPDVTVVWPAPPGQGYSLLVDGVARLRDGGDGPTTLGIEPRKAVLHRTPDGDPAEPSCITVLPRS